MKKADLYDRGGLILEVALIGEVSSV